MVNLARYHESTGLVCLRRKSDMSRVACKSGLFCGLLACYYTRYPQKTDDMPLFYQLLILASSPTQYLRLSSISSSLRVSISSNCCGWIRHFDRPSPCRCACNQPLRHQLHTVTCETWYSSAT